MFIQCQIDKGSDEVDCLSVFTLSGSQTQNLSVVCHVGVCMGGAGSMYACMGGWMGGWTGVFKYDTLWYTVNDLCSCPISEIQFKVSFNLLNFSKVNDPCSTVHCTN